MKAVDFVIAPSIDECVAAGVVPCPYTGNARPSQAWFDEARAKGVAPLWMVQETVSTRSQQGFGAGVADCQFAEGRARECGHVGAIAVVVSDGNGADAWDCSDYAAGWVSVATLPFFPYGALGVTQSFLTAGFGHPLSIDGEWVPETWGHGRVASQLVGPQAALSTPHDLNDVFYDFGQEADDMVDPAVQAQLDRIEGWFSGGGKYPTLEARIEKAITDALAPIVPTVTLTDEQRTDLTAKRDAINVLLG